jgi:3-oxoacyl-[acyl-carrier-protein] synthase II
MALLGACLALQDAGLSAGLEGGGEDTALVLASGHGATGSTAALLESVIRDGDPFSSPTHFAHSLHNSAAANLAIQLGLRGPTLTISQGSATVPSALLAARSLLASGRAARVLFGAVEELSELPGLLWQASGETLPPGEGAVFLVLEGGPGPSLSRLEDLAFGGDPPVPSGPDGAWVLGTGPGTLDLRDRWGLSPAAPAFDLAAAVLLLAGSPLKERAGRPTSVLCRWPGELPGSCRLL